MSTDLFSTMVQHCGHETAVAVIQHFGGMRLYVPMTWSAEHAFNAMGADHARKFIEHFAGEKLDIPRFRAAGPRRTRLIQKLHAGGRSKNEIARAADCTVRWVSKVVAENAASDDSQPELF